MSSPSAWMKDELNTWYVLLVKDLQRSLPEMRGILNYVEHRTLSGMLSHSVSGLSWVTSSRISFNLRNVSWP